MIDEVTVEEVMPDIKIAVPYLPTELPSNTELFITTVFTIEYCLSVISKI